MQSASEGTWLKARDADDVAAIVAGAARPLETVGGGSKRAVGRPVAADVLDLAALAGIAVSTSSAGS